MDLDNVDWSRINKKQAVMLRTQARKRELEVGQQFERGEVSEDEFIAAVELEEYLHIFIVTGLKPGEY